MALKQYKNTTPGLRGTVVVSYKDLDKVKPYAPLLCAKNKKAGRNNQGRITVRHRGGGKRQAYRIIDFKRNKLDIVGRVEYVEYDPNRTAFIALLSYADGEKRYMLAPNGLKEGQTVVSGNGVAPEVGNTLYLSEIPLGATIHNIELRPGQGAVMVRSAGAYAQLMARDGKYAIVKLASGEVRMILQTCLATIGTVSN